MLFDTFFIVDWSAAAQPKRGADSIWICHLDAASGSSTLANPATRSAAEERLLAAFRRELAAGRSVLAGFDFPFAYPAGLAARLGLAAPAWRGVWETIASVVIDDEKNRNNRFEAAAELNRRISGTAFPFWACPASRQCSHLGMRHHRRHEPEGLPERRLVEARISGPQPGWKLAGTGSAGGQALTGIPVVRRLHAALGAAAQVWPLETGLTVPERRAQVVFAEIYPSLVAAPPEAGEVKDAAQVRSLGRHFASLDRTGALAALFRADPTLTPAEQAQVEGEEGWILGVAGPTRRPRAARAAAHPALAAAEPA